VQKWYGSSGVCINENGELLMVLQGKPEEKKTWSIPSGGKELNETFQECCVREIEEETGYIAKIIEEIRVKSGRYEDLNISFEAHYFLVKIVGGKRNFQDPDNLIYDIGWKNVKEIMTLELSYPEDRDFLIDLITKEVTHLSDWLSNSYGTDPNLSANESFIEADIPDSLKGKTVIMILEYDDIDYITDGILNGVDSINIKYFSILNYDGQIIDNAMWVIGDSIMTEEYSKNMVQNIATNNNYTLFRDTISGSTIAPASSIGLVDHIDSNMFIANFELLGDPKLIIITRGSNDIYWSSQSGNPLQLGDVNSVDKNTTYGAIRYAIEYFQQNAPTAKIIWSTVMYRSDVDDVKVQQFNANLKMICSNYNVDVFDLYTVSGINASNQSQYLADGIHPNDDGIVLLESLWSNYLNTEK
jgi:ADP-ribose pyrophosphatase YjhB (NUDIX family)/lysophospholipase L1-like esterase